MKELSIEEKAKLYDEAKLKMSKAFNDNRCSIGFMNEIFPELTEDKDEKIRREIIVYINQTTLGCKQEEEAARKWIAWLEKQGEQKPVSVNETPKYLEGVVRIQGYKELTKFEKGFDRIADTYSHNKNKEGYNQSWYTKERAAEMLYWAKEELGLLGQQNPLEWSKEDDGMIKFLLTFFRKEQHATEESHIIIWLKSLRSKTRWRPSKPQLEALEFAIYDTELTNIRVILEDLLKQLKAL